MCAAVRQFDCGSVLQGGTHRRRCLQRLPQESPVLDRRQLIRYFVYIDYCSISSFGVISIEDTGSVDFEPLLRVCYYFQLPKRVHQQNSTVLSM